MQVEANNNYNTLGRMGPVYPRPEYRPKPKPEQNSTGTNGSQDKVNVSTSSREKAQQKALVKSSQSSLPVVAEGKLNLSGAKTLTELTALAIAELPPHGSNKGPHNVQGLGLMAPRYV